MFGPVTMARRGQPTAAAVQAAVVGGVGLARAPHRRLHHRMAGGRSASNTRLASISGRTASASAAHSARADATSRVERAAAAAWIGPAKATASSRNASKVSASMASARSAAWAIRASRSASSTVVKRHWLASVWRWMKVAFRGGWKQGLGLPWPTASMK